MELRSVRLLLGDKIPVSGAGKKREGKFLGKSNSGQS